MAEASFSDLLSSPKSWVGVDVALGAYTSTADALAGIRQLAGGSSASFWRITGTATLDRALDEGMLAIPTLVAALQQSWLPRYH